jgi:hypothetical protein
LVLFFKKELLACAFPRRPRHHDFIIIVVWLQLAKQHFSCNIATVALIGAAGSHGRVLAAALARQNGSVPHHTPVRIDRET